MGDPEKLEEWVRRERSTRALWQALWPDERASVVMADDLGMEFESRQTLATGIHFTTWVLGFPYDDGWTLRFGGRLTDQRVEALEEELQGPNPLSPYVLEFDLSLTHKFLEGKTFVEGETEHSLPAIPIDASDSSVRAILETNGRRLDRIWASVGGCSIEGFQALALWAMRHYNFTRAGTPTVAMVCAALVYGDRNLAAWLLREYEQTRIFYVRSGEDSYTRGPSGEIRPDIARLLSKIEQGSP